MSGDIKFVVLGGSGVATPELIDVLVKRSDERPALNLVLLGRTEEKLRTVGELCRRMAQGATPPLNIFYTTDLEEALEGADYILNQIRVGGMKARAFDESFPDELGIPGEETVGPGGFANALRTIPVVLEYCRQIEKHAPRALLLNLTNPSSFIQYAITRYTWVSAIGTCDSPVFVTREVARAVGAPREELIISYVGMHHFGWITKVLWNHEDMMPLLLEKADGFSAKLGVDADVIRAIGAIPSPYFKYYFHADRMLARKRGKRTRAEELMELQEIMLEEYRGHTSAEKPEHLVRRKAVWYQEIIAPVLLSAMNDSRQEMILNVVNRTLIPFLPGEAIVEVPTIVGRDEIRPLAVDVASVPPDVVVMIQLNCAFEMLAVEAIVEGSYSKALRALLLNPLVRTAEQAKGVLERIWPKS